MKAWWAYWLTLLVGAAFWVVAVVTLGRDDLATALHEPVWAAILVAPIFVAGLKPRPIPREP
jgi:hypothetical protein